MCALAQPQGQGSDTEIPWEPPCPHPAAHTSRTTRQLQGRMAPAEGAAAPPSRAWRPGSGTDPPPSSQPAPLGCPAEPRRWGAWAAARRPLPRGPCKGTAHGLADHPLCGHRPRSPSRTKGQALLRWGEGTVSPPGSLWCGGPAFVSHKAAGPGSPRSSSREHSSPRGRRCPASRAPGPELCRMAARPQPGAWGQNAACSVQPSPAPLFQDPHQAASQGGFPPSSGLDGAGPDPAQGPCDLEPGPRPTLGHGAAQVSGSLSPTAPPHGERAAPWESASEASAEGFSAARGARAAAQGLPHGPQPARTWEDRPQPAGALGRGEAPDNAVKQEADLLPLCRGQEEDSGPCRGQTCQPARAQVAGTPAGWLRGGKPEQSHKAACQGCPQAPTWMTSHGPSNPTGHTHARARTHTSGHRATSLCDGQGGTQVPLAGSGPALTCCLPRPRTG